MIFIERLCNSYPNDKELLGMICTVQLYSLDLYNGIYFQHNVSYVTLLKVCHCYPWEAHQKVYQRQNQIALYISHIQSNYTFHYTFS